MRLNVLFFALLCSCVVSAGPAPPSQSTVIVSVIGVCPPRALEGATIELIADDGRMISHESTGVDGSASFASSVFRSKLLLVACHPDYFCGAMKLQPNPGEKLTIAIAHLLVADGATNRQKVSAAESTGYAEPVRRR
jgi:hypothetical protein